MRISAAYLVATICFAHGVVSLPANSRVSTGETGPTRMTTPSSTPTTSSLGGVGAATTTPRVGATSTPGLLNPTASGSTSTPGVVPTQSTSPTSSTGPGNSTVAPTTGNSTLPGNSTSGASCPRDAKPYVMKVTDETDAPKNQTTQAKTARRAIDYIRSLFSPRSNPYGGGSGSGYGGQSYGHGQPSSSRPPRPPSPVREFIGYHGTNGSGGSGTGVTTPRHFNGADAELGPGLYLADNIYVAETFATGSARPRRDRYNRGYRDVSLASTYEYVCVVKARQDQWRNVFVPKVWITSDLIARSVGGQNNPALIQAQRDLVASSGGHYDTTVRFSTLRRGDPSSNQMVIPPSLLPSVVVTECVPYCEGRPTTFELGVPDTFNYFNLRQAWGIVGQAP